MGRAWLYSSVLHVALAALLYFGLPSLSRPPPAMEQAITVELVNEAPDAEPKPPAPAPAATAPAPEQKAASPNPSPTPPPPEPRSSPRPSPSRRRRPSRPRRRPSQRPNPCRRPSPMWPRPSRRRTRCRRPRCRPSRHRRPSPRWPSPSRRRADAAARVATRAQPAPSPTSPRRARAGSPQPEAARACARTRRRRQARAPAGAATAGATAEPAPSRREAGTAPARRRRPRRPSRDPAGAASRAEPAHEDAFAALLKSVEQLDRRTQSDTTQTGQGRVAATEGQARSALGEGRLSLSEVDALSRQIDGCWTVPVGVEGIEDMVVQLRIQVRPDRTVQNVTIEDQSRLGRDSTFRAVAESARRAVDRCSPLSCRLGNTRSGGTSTLELRPEDAITVDAPHAPEIARLPGARSGRDWPCGPGASA